MKYTPGSQIKCYKTKQIKEKPSRILSKLKLISWKKRSRSGWKSTSTESQCDNSLEKSSLWCSSSRPKRQLGKNWNAGVEEVGHEFQLFPLIMPQLLSRKCICLREKKWYFSAVCSFRIEQEERDSGRDGGNEELSVPGPPPPTQQAGRHSKKKSPLFHHSMLILNYYYFRLWCVWNVTPWRRYTEVCVHEAELNGKQQ